MIKLNIGKHCIETELRRQHNRSLSEYFRSESDKERLEEDIDMLTTALKQLDFAHLRSRYPELAGGHDDADVSLSKVGQDQIAITVNGKAVGCRL